MQKPKATPVINIAKKKDNKKLNHTRFANHFLRNDILICTAEEVFYHYDDGYF